MVLPLLNPLPALGVVLHVGLTCAREVDAHGSHHGVGRVRLALLQGTDVVLAALLVLIARVAREGEGLEVGRHRRYLSIWLSTFKFTEVPYELDAAKCPFGSARTRSYPCPNKNQKETSHEDGLYPFP